MREVLAIVCALAGAAEAGPAVAADQTPEMRAYMTTVRDAVGAAWHPGTVLGSHVQGRDLGPWRVVLEVSIGPEGNVTAVAVAQSSGLAAFDQEAANAFLVVPRFQPPPATLIDPKTGALTFPFTFITPGFEPPPYLDDGDQRSPATGSWKVGSWAAGERKDMGVAGGTARLSEWSVAAEAEYRLPRRYILELLVPYESIRYREPAGMIRQLDGFGDATLHLHQAGRYHGWYTSGFVGVQLPIGRTEAMPVAGTAAAIVQLGSGTFEPEMGGCLLHPLPAATRLGFCDHARISVYANSHGFRDSFAFDGRLFAERPWLDRQLSTYAAVKLTQLFAAGLQGEAIPDTDSVTFSGEVGAWFWILRGLAIHAGAELSFYSNRFDDRRFTAGLTWDFDLP